MNSPEADTRKITVNFGMKALLLLKIFLACFTPLTCLNPYEYREQFSDHCGQAFVYTEEGAFVVEAYDRYYFNATNATVMSVSYKGSEIKCYTYAPPSVTDQAPKITLLPNATDYCEYVTIMLIHLNRTKKVEEKLLWLVTNAKMQDLTMGKLGSSADAVAPYHQGTTTDERDRNHSHLRFFYVLCQPGLIEVDKVDREPFKPGKFAKDHDLRAPYAGFTYLGSFLFPRDKANGRAEGRKVCSGTCKTRVCSCEPLGKLAISDGDKCFLSVDAKTDATPPPTAVG